MRRRLYAAILLVIAGKANASELVYTPVNPVFGGNPMNGAVLLNAAQAQNDFKDPDSLKSNTPRSALAQFNETLQRSILNRIASGLTSRLVGGSGELLTGEPVETAEFKVQIIDLGGGALEITTTDKVTGQTQSFSVGETP